MFRVDYEVLEFVCQKVNEYVAEYECGISMKGEEEDYGLDLLFTGITEADKYYETEYEVKTMRGRYNDREFLTKIAGRNRSCRYCYSARTYEDFDRDKTPMPEEFKGGKPIMMINSTDKYGNLTGKWHKLEEVKGGLIFVKEGEILIFTQEALKKAFLGFVWIKCSHTTDFGDRGRHWERKAAIDIDKWSARIKCEVPRKFWEEKNDKCGDS